MSHDLNNLVMQMRQNRDAFSPGRVQKEVAKETKERQEATSQPNQSNPVNPVDF